MGSAREIIKHAGEPPSFSPSYRTSIAMWMVEEKVYEWRDGTKVEVPVQVFMPDFRSGTREERQRASKDMAEAYCRAMNAIEKVLRPEPGKMDHRDPFAVIITMDLIGEAIHKIVTRPTESPRPVEDPRCAGPDVEATVDEILSRFPEFPDLTSYERAKSEIRSSLAEAIRFYSGRKAKIAAPDIVSLDLAFWLPRDGEGNSAYHARLDDLSYEILSDEDKGKVQKEMNRRGVWIPGGSGEMRYSVTAKPVTPGAPLVDPRYTEFLAKEGGGPMVTSKTGWAEGTDATAEKMVPREYAREEAEAVVAEAMEDPLFKFYPHQICVHHRQILREDQKGWITSSVTGILNRPEEPKDPRDKYKLVIDCGHVEPTEIEKKAIAHEADKILAGRPHRKGNVPEVWQVVYIHRGEKPTEEQFKLITAYARTVLDPANSLVRVDDMRSATEAMLGIYARSKGLDPSKYEAGPLPGPEFGIPDPDIKDRIIFALAEAITLIPGADSAIQAAANSYGDTMSAESTLSSIEEWIARVKEKPTEEEAKQPKPGLPYTRYFNTLIKEHLRSRNEAFGSFRDPSKRSIIAAIEQAVDSAIELHENRPSEGRIADLSIDIEMHIDNLKRSMVGKNNRSVDQHSRWSIRKIAALAIHALSCPDPVERTEAPQGEMFGREAQ